MGQKVAASADDRRVEVLQALRDRLDTEGELAISRFIRIKGLIAFVVMVALAALFWYFLLDGLVKGAIERYGSEAVGAKVELSRVNVTLLPLGVRLEGLSIADPAEPMKNLIEVGSAEFRMDPMRALMKKAIIDHMSVEGMRFATARRTTGALPIKEEPKPEEPKPEDKGSSFELPALDLPDLRDAISEDDLETVRLARRLERQMDTVQQNFRTAMANLPTGGEADAYKARMKAIEAGIRSGGPERIRAAIDDAEAMKAELGGKAGALRAASEGMKADLASLRRDMKSLDKMPSKDLQWLSDKYSLSPEGLRNMSRMLFGSTVDGYVGKVAGYYRTAAPMIERMRAAKAEDRKPVRGKGVDVSFREREPLPSLLIRKISASATIESGVLKGTVTDVASDQAVLGRPTVFSFGADNMKDMDGLSIEGTIDHRKPRAAIDKITLKATGSRIGGMRLSKDFPVSLGSGLADTEINATLKGGRIEAAVAITVREAEFGPDGELRPGSMQEALANALADIKGFTINATATGTLTDYDMKLTSDIDEILKAALNRMVSQKKAEIERELRARIDELTNAQVAGVRSRMGQLEGMATGVAESAEGLASVDAQIDKARTDAEAELKRQAEQKLKGKVDEKKDQLENQLKDKFKKLF